MGHVTFTQRGQRLAPIVLCPNHTLSPIAKENREHLCAEQDISLNKQLSASLLSHHFYCLVLNIPHLLQCSHEPSVNHTCISTPAILFCAQSITDQKKACLDFIQSHPLMNFIGLLKIGTADLAQPNNSCQS